MTSWNIGAVWYDGHLKNCALTTHTTFPGRAIEIAVVALHQPACGAAAVDGAGE
jgi:hypothetical protein